MKAILALNGIGNIDADVDSHVLQGNVFDALNVRIQRDKSRLARDGAAPVTSRLVYSRDEALARQGSAYAAFRLSNIVGIPHVTEVKFVDRVAVERLNVTKINELRKTVREGIERAAQSVGNIRPALGLPDTDY